MRVSQHLYIFKYFKSLASVASCDFVALLSHLVCPHCWPRQRSCAREPLQMIDWEPDRRGGCWLGRVRTESSTWRRRWWEARRELSGMRRSLPWNTQVREKPQYNGLLQPWRMDRLSSDGVWGWEKHRPGPPANGTVTAKKRFLSDCNVVRRNVLHLL